MDHDGWVVQLYVRLFEVLFYIESTTFFHSMSLRAGSTRLSALTRRQKSLFSLASIGTLTIGLVVKSIASSHGHQTPRYISVTSRHPIARSLSSAQSIFSFTSTNSNMANLIPPQAPPSWTHSAEDVMRLTKSAIEEDRKVQDTVGGLAAKDCNYQSVRSIHIRIPYHSPTLFILQVFVNPPQLHSPSDPH